jgi:Zn-dependent metalloprotease
MKPLWYLGSLYRILRSTWKIYLVNWGHRRAGSLRSMSDPKSEGQPDTYGGKLENNRMWAPHTSKWLLRVHTNSGVLNHWFYILTIEVRNKWHWKLL